MGFRALEELPVEEPRSRGFRPLESTAPPPADEPPPGPPAPVSVAAVEPAGTAGPEYPPMSLRGLVPELPAVVRAAAQATTGGQNVMGARATRGPEVVGKITTAPFRPQPHTQVYPPLVTAPQQEMSATDQTIPMGGGSRAQAARSMSALAGHATMEAAGGLARLAGEAGSDLGVPGAGRLTTLGGAATRAARSNLGRLSAPFTETPAAERGPMDPGQRVERIASWMTSPANIAAVGQQLPQLVGVGASLLGAPAGATLLTTIGLPVTGREYGAYRDKGYDAPLALLGALGQAATEVLPEFAWVQIARSTRLADLRGFTAMAPAERAAVLSGLAKQYGFIAASELTNEQVSTIGNWLVAKGMQDPDATLEQLAREMADTLRQTALFAPIMAGTAHAGQALRRAVTPTITPESLIAREIDRAVRETDVPVREPSYATEERIQPQRDLAEYQRADVLGEAQRAYRDVAAPVVGEDAQAGDRDRARQGSEKPALVAEIMREFQLPPDDRRGPPPAGAKVLDMEKLEEGRLAVDAMEREGIAGVKRRGEEYGATEDLVRRDASGRIVGGFGATHVNSAHAAIRRMESLARKGVSGKNWYADSANAILESTGGDVNAATRIAQVLAITSAGTEIKANFTMASKALEQYARGEPIKVTTQDRNKMISGLLYHGRVPESVKVDDFYRNLAQHINGAKPERPVTDRWQFRIASGESGVQSGTRQQYEYASVLASEAARRLGWKPEEAQAAMWVAMKAKSKFESMKASASKAKDSKYAGVSDKELQKQALEFARTSYASEIERRQWKPPSGAAFPSVEELRAAHQTITAEVKPSTKTEIGQMVQAMPAERLKSFQREMLQVVGGVDNFMSAFGLNSTQYTYESGIVAYEGGLAPNVILSVKAEKATVDRIAKGWMYVFKQDAVPYFRADRKLVDDPNATRGVIVKADNVTPGREKKFYQFLRDQVHKDIGYTHEEGNFIILKFHNQDTQEFLERLDSALKSPDNPLNIVSAFDYGAESEYPYHDWQQDPTGEALLDQASAGQSPNLRQRLADWANAFERAVGQAPVRRGSGAAEDQLASVAGVQRAQRQVSKADVDKIRAMSAEKRDNTEVQDFPGGKEAFKLYEAQKLAPKPDGKLKRVTERNTFALWQEADFIINVDGHLYEVTKQEDPDAADDDEASFVYAYESLERPGRLVTTTTADAQELVNEIRIDDPSIAGVRRAPELWHNPDWFGRPATAEVYASKSMRGNRFSMPTGLHAYDTVWKVRGVSLGRTFASRADAERALEEKGFVKTDSSVVGVRRVDETDAYKAAAASAERVFSDYGSAKAAYAKLKGTNNGRMLDVDLARELVPEYVADPTLSPAVHEPASEFIKKLYKELLSKPTPAGLLRAVTVTGGGPGSGKSRMISDWFEQEVKFADIGYDTTMSSFESIDKKIKDALDKNRVVLLRFVDRDPGESYEFGVVNRMQNPKDRRVVKIDEHARTHAKAREAIRQVYQKYKDDDRVDIMVLRKEPGNGTYFEEVPQIREWTYDDAIEETVSAAERAYAAGRITDEQLEATAAGLDEAHIPRPRAAGVQGAARQGVAGSLQKDVRAGREREGVAATVNMATDQRTADPAEVGLRTFDLKKANTAALKARTRPLLPGEQRIVAGALKDLHAAGMPRYLTDTIKGWATYNTELPYDAAYFAQDHILGVSLGSIAESLNRGRGHRTYLRSNIAHELGHAIDSVGYDDEAGFLAFSHESPRMDFALELADKSDGAKTGKDYVFAPYGDLMQEAWKVYVGISTPKFLKTYLDYPLASAWHNQNSTTKSEVFAQLHALYFNNRPVLRQHFPLWTKLFEDIYGKGQGDAADGFVKARRRLQRALQVESSDVSGARAFERDVVGIGREDLGGARGRPPGPGVGEGAGRGARPPSGRGPDRGRTAPSIAGVARGWSAEQPGHFDNIVRELQNKVVDLKRVQQAIRDAGGVISSAVDPYLSEELYHGRVSTMVKRFEKNEMMPLLEEMAREGVSPDELGEYLWARHAPEANARLARINPSGAPDLSGMSDAEAAQVEARIRAAGKMALMNRFAAKVDAITKGTRDILLNEGLIDQKTYDAWESAYRFYVPLMREADDVPGTAGQGFQIRGQESRRRVGSSRAAVDIMAAVIMARERAIERSEKARVGRDLVKLAEDFPNPSFWRVDSPPKSNRIDPRTGLVHNTIDPMYYAQDNVYVVKEKDQNGNVVERVIVFNERNERALRLARAMKSLDVVRIAGLTKIVNKVSRFFANLATQWNPLFWATNFVRDVQTAGVNLQSTPLNGQAGRVMSRIPQSLAGMIDAEFRNGNSTYAKWYREYEEAGGKTGWMDVFDSLRDRQAEIEALITRAGRSSANPAKWAEWTFDVIQKTNSIIENSARLSSYVVARENGIPQREAASLAKNLTVNFNRKGNRSSATNAWFMFFNANVQGSARMLQGLAQSPKAQAIVGVMAALGAAMELINRMIGDHDKEPGEDNPYELLSGWEKERNWIIMLPRSGDKGEELTDEDGNVVARYIKVPLPYGFNVFPSAGRIAMEAILGASKSRLVTERRGPMELAADYANVLVDAFMPLGQTATFLQYVAPTIADPFVQMGENKKFSGVPMVPERGQFDKGLPRSEMYFASNSEVAKDLARWLNGIAGGNEIEQSWLSVYPGHIEHVFRTMTGGAGTFMLGMFEFGKHLGERAVGKEPEPMQASRIPFVGKFYGEVDERAIESKYYRIKEKADPIAQRIKNLRKAGEDERADQLEQEHLPLVEFSRAATTSRFGKERTRLGKEMRETRELPISDREKAKREIRRERSELFKRAIEAYNQAAEEGRR